jgi:hypothetical protein
MTKTLEETPSGEKVRVIKFSSQKQLRDRGYIPYAEVAKRLNTNIRIIYRYRERGILPFLYAKIATAKPITIMEKEDYEFIRLLQGKNRMQLVSLSETTTNKIHKSKIQTYLDPFRSPSKRFKKE